MRAWLDEDPEQSTVAWPLAMVVVFFAAAAAAIAYIRGLAAAEPLRDQAEFGLWAVLLGVVAGFAAAALPVFAVWLRSFTRHDARVGARRVAGWFAVPGALLLLIFAGLWLGGDGTPDSLPERLNREQRWLPTFVALAMLPGLACFVALRDLALRPPPRCADGRAGLGFVLRLRGDLRRLLATFAAFLTVLVIATGMRRKALLAFDPTLSIPSEEVLLYGLLFAVTLAGLYLPAAAAIDRRALAIIDAVAPLPDPEQPDAFAGGTARRRELCAAAGVGTSWQSFQTVVVIAGPLLTALISGAIDG